MTYETLKVESLNGICVMAFNRPDKLNAFDRQMVIETQDAIKNISEDNSIKVVIVTGTGLSLIHI